MAAARPHLLHTSLLKSLRRAAKPLLRFRKNQLGYSEGRLSPCNLISAEFISPCEDRLRFHRRRVTENSFLIAYDVPHPADGQLP